MTHQNDRMAQDVENARAHIASHVPCPPEVLADIERRRLANLRRTEEEVQRAHAAQQHDMAVSMRARALDASVRARRGTSPGDWERMVQRSQQAIKLDRGTPARGVGT